jgi:3-phenylpropionate/cinnamic acid dioxygenase small subunit
VVDQNALSTDMATRAIPPQSLGELADHYAIIDVLHEYCEAVDELRVDDILAIFTEDCRFDRGFDNVYNSRAELGKFLGGGLRRYSGTSHHLTNVRVALIDEQTATASSYVYASHWYVGETQTSELWARYRDVLVKTDGVWRIAKRKIRMVGAKHFPLNGSPTPFETLPRDVGSSAAG